MSESASGTPGSGSNYPQPSEVGRIEIPARLASKLSSQECKQLEDHARKHHDSRKMLAKVSLVVQPSWSIDMVQTVSHKGEEEHRIAHTTTSLSERSSCR